MANIIMSHSFDTDETHREHGLSAMEGLKLALLIGRKHDGLIGRVELNAHHTAHLFDEERIGGESEALGPVRLHREELKDAMAWAARFRRLARDYERLDTTLKGLHYVAFAILMCARFLNPTPPTS